MPSTISTYYTFQAGTKARASQVNTNFSNYRGDLLPINEATVTASDNVHNLGSADHYWKTGYLAEIDLRTSTSTASLVLKGDTSVTAGAYLFQIESTTYFKVDTQGVEFNGLTTTSRLRINSSSVVTAGAADVLFGSSTIASFAAGGIKRKSLDTGEYTTTANQAGQYLFVGQTTVSRTMTSASPWTITSGRMNVRGTGILNFELYGTRLSDAPALGAGNDVQTIVVELHLGATTTALSVVHTKHICVSQRRGNTATGNIISHFDTSYFSFNYGTSESVFRVQAYVIEDFDTTDGANSYSATAALLVREI
jgi:hypothetical protein